MSKKVLANLTEEQVRTLDELTEKLGLQSRMDGLRTMIDLFAIVSDKNNPRSVAMFTDGQSVSVLLSKHITTLSPEDSASVREASFKSRYTNRGVNTDFEIIYHERFAVEKVGGYDE